MARKDVKAQTPDNERLLKIQDAADRLGCSTRAVWRLAASGQLPVIRMQGLGTRIREADLDAMIRSAAAAADHR